MSERTEECVNLPADLLAALRVLATLPDAEGESTADGWWAALRWQSHEQRPAAYQVSDALAVVRRYAGEGT